MATGIAYDPVDTRSWPVLTAASQSATTTRIDQWGPNMEHVVLTGSFTLDGYGNVLGGTITAIDSVANVATYPDYSISSIAIDVVTFSNFLLAGDTAGLLQSLLGGGDAFTGSGGADYLEGFGGNDSVSGGGGNDTINGGVGNDTIRGGAGGDMLVGQGGADRLYGEGGNDTVNWQAGDTFVGGTGTDTLRILGAGVSLNLRTLANSAIATTEIINIQGTGNNQLYLNLDEVLAINETDTLRVMGNAGDVCHRGGGWTREAGVVTFGANDYIHYTQVSSLSTAHLYVDTDITAATA